MTEFGPTGRVVYESRYSRTKPNGEKEVWPETAERVVDGNLALTNHRHEGLYERQDLIDLIEPFKALPAGRHLAMSGVTGRELLFNCLSYETEIVTDRGVEEIGSREGDEIRVRDGNGRWVSTTVESYGRQQLRKVTWTCGNQSKVVYATPEHNWYVSRTTKEPLMKVKTDDLQPGFSVTKSSRGKGSLPDVSPVGVQAGFIFGDGTETPHGSLAYFCGDKDRDVLPYFDNVKTHDRGDGVLITPHVFPKSFKRTPLSGEGTPYLFGWLAGYFAADGCVDDRGLPSMHSAVKSNLETVRSVAALLGIGTNSIRAYERQGYGGESTIYTMCFDASSLNEDFFILSHHKQRWLNSSVKKRNYSRWTVKSVESTDRFEEVYCVEVPTTHSFLLADGLLTGNCHVAPWPDDLTEHFEFTFMRLMEGGGVGSSYSSNYLTDYPEIVNTPTIHIVCDPEHPDYADMAESGVLSSEFDSDWNGAFQVEDSREGWAEALVQAIRDHYQVTKHPDRVFDVSRVRGKGARLKTFGGTASGPEPLGWMLHEVNEVLSNRDQKKLNGIAAMEIDHSIAKCVVSGGARRSARMAMMHWDDLWIREFLNCKSSDENVDHWTTNISVEVDDEFWAKVDEGDEHASWVFGQIVNGMLNNGEPGFWNSSLSNEGEPNPVTCTNPCITRDTWVQTANGPRQVDELIGSSFVAVVDGKPYNTLSNGFFKTGHKDVYKVHTSEGWVVNATEDHEFYSPDGTRIALEKLNQGDKLRLSDHRTVVPWGGPGTDIEGYTLGWFVGDGTFGSQAILQSQGKQETQYSRERMEDYVRSLYHRSDFRGWNGPYTTGQYRLASKAFTEVVNSYGITKGNKTVTPKVERASYDFTVGFLRGLFDTDGNVEYGKKTGVSIRLSSIDYPALQAVQRMLGRLGIRSNISVMKGESDMTCPNTGNTYTSQTCYRLLITNRVNVARFRDVVGLWHSKKLGQLDNFVSSYSSEYEVKFEATFDRMVYVGKDDVFDCTVDRVYDFCGNGLYLRDCGEIQLEPWENCNLGHINLSAFVREDGRVDMLGLLEAHRLMTRYLIRATYGDVSSPEQAEVLARNRRIGVGHFGLASMAAKMGIPYSEIPDSPRIENMLTELAVEVENAAREYAHELRIPVPVKTRTVAPTGCQSPETAVTTGEGVLELGELVNPDGDVWQLLNTDTPQESGSEKVTAGYVNGFADTKRITLHSGGVLESTPDHRFRVLDGDVYRWCRADELDSGMKVVCKIGGYEKTAEPLLDRTPYEHDRSAGVQPRGITLPGAMSPEFAWWLGLYHADGSNHEKAIRLSLGKGKDGARDEFTRITGELFGIEARVGDETRYDMSIVSIGSRELIHFLGNNGLLKDLSHEVSIPKLVRKSSNRSLQAFIEGYRCGDGSQTGNTKYIDTTSPNMARHLHACLRAVGQNVRVSRRDKRDDALGNRPIYRVYNVGYGSLGVDTSKKIHKEIRHDLEILESVGEGLVSDKVVSVEDSRSMTLDLSVPVNNTYVAGSALSHNTIAKLPGASEGIHPILMQFFTRRIRFNRVDPNEARILQDYRDAGYHVEPCVYAANTDVVSIPTKDILMSEVEERYGAEAADRIVETYDDVSVDTMLAVQAMYQTFWSDNAVSYTVNIDPGTVGYDELSDAILRHHNSLKGATVFPAMSMPQAPYEKMSREQYEAATNQEVAESFDEECASGACPVW